MRSRFILRRREPQQAFPRGKNRTVPPPGWICPGCRGHWPEHRKPKRRPGNRGLPAPGQKDSALRQLDAHEAGVFNHFIGHELLLGGGVLRLQDHRGRSSGRRHRDPSFRAGWAFPADGLAVAAGSRAPRTRPGQHLLDGGGAGGAGAAVTGVWQPTGHRRQFLRAHGGRTPDYFPGGSRVPARTYRPPTAGRLCAGHVWGGLAERRLAEGLSMDRNQTRRPPPPLQHRSARNNSSNTAPNLRAAPRVCCWNSISFGIRPGRLNTAPSSFR